MPNLPYPYLDQSEFPTVDPEFLTALQGNLDALALDAQSLGSQVGGARMHGPFTSAVTAALIQNAGEFVTYTHNLGLSTAQQASCVATGHLFDGFFSALASWRLDACTADDVTFNIANPSTRTDVQAGLKFWLLVT